MTEIYTKKTRKLLFYPHRPGTLPEQPEHLRECDNSFYQDLNNPQNHVKKSKDL